MKKLSLCPLLPVLVALMFTLSCGSITSPKPGLNIIASISQQTVQSMTFRIGVENTGTETKSLSFRNSQFFDIEVRNGGGTLVWQYSHDAFFLDFVWGLELAPGESSVRDFAWDLTGNNGNALPAGRYRAKVSITSSPREENLVTEIKVSI